MPVPPFAKAYSRGALIIDTGGGGCDDWRDHGMHAISHIYRYIEIHRRCSTDVKNIFLRLGYLPLFFFFSIVCRVLRSCSVSRVRRDVGLLFWLVCSIEVSAAMCDGHAPRERGTARSSSCFFSLCGVRGVGAVWAFAIRLFAFLFCALRHYIKYQQYLHAGCLGVCVYVCFAGGGTGGDDLVAGVHLPHDGSGRDDVAIDAG